ncbi:MAG TPA: hypothetical protein VF331_06395 [Polyangiales bacterium]
MDVIITKQAYASLHPRRPTPTALAKADAQCTYEVNGCCDCANGGQEIAVAHDQVDAFRARFACTGGCTQRYRECGTGKVACERGLCVYHEPLSP